MSRPRCGAPLGPTTDRRRTNVTCRHIVHAEGAHCHRHLTEAEQIESLDEELRKAVQT